MKYQFVIAIVLGIVLSNIACSGSSVNGQSNDQGIINASNNVTSNTEQLRPMSTPEIPKADNPIILKEKLKTTDLTGDEAKSLAKVVGLDDICVSQPSNPPHAPTDEYFEKVIQANFNSIGGNIYLLDLSCRSVKVPSQGASNNNFFLYSEKDVPTLSRMVFEYFEKNLETGKYTRFITYFPNGGSEFNPNTKELVVTANFVHIANCGYRSAYRFEDGKPVLEEVRANWDCENNYPDGKQWIKENIEKMRKLTAETIDELKSS